MPCHTITFVTHQPNNRCTFLSVPTQNPNIGYDVMARCIIDVVRFTVRLGVTFESKFDRDRLFI